MSKLRFYIDKAMSGDNLRAVLIMASAIVTMVLVYVGLSHLLHLNLPYHRIIQLLIDPSCIHPEDGLYWMQLFMAMSGTVLITGILFSMLTNMWAERSNRFSRGLNSYNFRNHLLFLGDSPMLADTIEGAAKGGKEMIVVMTLSDAVTVTERLLAQISDEDIERRLVILYGDYERLEQMQRAKADSAKAVYILGKKENGNWRTENDDSINLSCLQHLRTMRRGQKELQDVYLLLRQPHLLRGTQLSNEQPASDGIRLHVIHQHESWAQRVLVSCASVGGTHYPTLDRGHLEKDATYRVHLVVAGSGRMAQAFATTAAHIAHYPNYITRGVRTRITIVDEDIDDFIQMMRGQYSALMRLSYWTLKNGQLEMESEHQPTPENDFLDVEWEFIRAKISAQPVRNYMAFVAEDEYDLLTVALTSDEANQNICEAISLPRIVQDMQIPVFVYQPDSTAMADWMHAASCFRHIYPFGMSGDCYDPLMQQRIHWAQRSNEVYNRYLCSIGQEQQTQGWDELRMVDQYSNLYHANYDYATLRRISDKELYGRLEHNRWNMEKLLMGFDALYSSKERQRADRMSAEKKQLKARFVHPNIAPFEDLTSDTQEIDRILVEHLLEEMEN